MASSKLLVIFVLAIFVPLSFAKEYIVGDKENGWKIGFDYEAWAKGKQFAVGDKLIFKYAKGSHNVIEVKESEYKECKAPAGANELSTGEDEVKLDAPGKRYFICGVGKHCEMGKQKVAIDVKSSSGSALASNPDASSPPIESNSSPIESTKSSSTETTSTPVAPTPSNNHATTGKTYRWMVIISGIIGFLMT